MKATLVIWHGYLLGATGSNIYTRHLVDSWLRAGHDVVLACQEPHPEAYDDIHDVVHLVHDEIADVARADAMRELRTPPEGSGRCTMVVPDIHGVLPVYVLDRYAGFEVVRVTELDERGLDRYGAAHAAAMRWVVESFAPAGVLINHASPLPAALQPVLVEAGVPYAVKVHGSELEYAIVDDARLVAPAADALAHAASILVGSSHIADRTRELLGDDALAGDRVAVIPPGVALDRFVPLPDTSHDTRASALQALRDAVVERAAIDAGGRTTQTSESVHALVAGAGATTLVDDLAALHGSYEERHIEATAAEQLAAISADARLITFVGKLIPQKGVDLLLAALPSVFDTHPDARVVIAGFGPQRDALEALLLAMQAGDVDVIDAIAAGAARLSGAVDGELVQLSAFLARARARGEFEAWLAAAARTRVAERVSWLGLVDHSILARLWPLCEISLVPSVLAEAFGMVAAEAAACGAVPLVGDHSGLADAAQVIERNGVSPVRVDFSDAAAIVDHLRDAMLVRLALDPAERARQSASARANVAGAWGWDHLAEIVAQEMTGAHISR